jgi:hypothetical protein
MGLHATLFRYKELTQDGGVEADRSKHNLANRVDGTAKRAAFVF